MTYLLWRNIPEELRRKRNYVKIPVRLSNPYRFVRLQVAGDYIDIDYRGTTANIENVHIALNGGDKLSLDYAPLQTPFSYIDINWEPSEDGKQVVLIVGRELFRTVRTKSDVRLVADFIGIAKDTTLQSILGRLDIPLSVLRDALKPARTTPSQELSAYSLAAGGSVSIDKTSLDGWSAIVAAVRATYDPAATAGVRVLWLYSPDGASYDSEEDAMAQGNYYDLSFAAGSTRQASILVPVFTPYVRIVIKNLDPASAATIDAWTLLMR